MVESFFKKKQAAKLDPYEVAEDVGALQRLPKDDEGNIKLELTKKIKITDDSYIFRFGFP